MSIVVALYSCTESGGTTIADGSGNGYTALHNGTATGTELYLDSTAYLDLPFNLSLRTSVTVSLFVKLDALVECVVFSTSASSSVNSLELAITSSGVLRATHVTASTEYSIQSTAVITAGIITHIAYTYNYGTTSQVLYINGAMVRYEASVAQLLYNDTNVVIGGKASKEASKFSGDVKSIYIGSTALTPGGVEALFKATNAA
ncbi:unnamed protein product, partial [Phaeothamnion confervicola]